MELQRVFGHGRWQWIMNLSQPVLAWLSLVMAIQAIRFWRRPKPALQRVRVVAPSRRFGNRR